jgi:uncharacterized membrane protein YsdA (DUF1294 family)
MSPIPLFSLALSLGLVYLVMSVACFASYARDKAAAGQRPRRGQPAPRRTPERRLLLLGLACGWPGGLLAQRLLRHKTAKPAFQALFWTSVAANLALAGLLAWAACAIQR